MSESTGSTVPVYEPLEPAPAPTPAKKKRRKTVTRGKRDKDKESKIPVRVYAYGCRTPHERLGDFNWQALLRHRYQNALVRLELRRRDEYHALLAARNPLVASASQALACVEAEKDAARAAMAGNRDEEPRQRLRAALAQLTPARAALTAAEAIERVVPATRQLLHAQSRAHRERQKDAYEEYGAMANEATGLGLYWSSRVKVNQAMADAGRGEPPNFHRWTGSGRIDVQLQNGLTVAEALAGRDTQLRLVPAGYVGKKATHVARNRSMEAWLRVGSYNKRGQVCPSGRNPAWLRVLFKYHRDLPPDALIRWASLFRRRVGAQYHWSIQFSVSMPVWPVKPGRGEGRVGIDLGWRLLTGDDIAPGEQGSMRVASWCGDDGRTGEMRLSPEHCARWEDADRIRSRRDILFELARDRLRGWLREQREGGQPVSEWLRHETTHLHCWKQADSLVRLVTQWNDARHPERRSPGDHTILTWLLGRKFWSAGRWHTEGWLVEDTFLHNMEDHIRQKAVRHRDQLFRQFAIALRKDYQTVCLENINWAQLARRQRIDRATGDAVEQTHETARRQRQRAAPGRCAELLRAVFEDVILRDPAYTTVRCALCGEMDPFDAARERVRTCAHCHRQQDQDRRAAFNLRDGMAPIP